MEIRQLTYFLKACDYGNIASAGEQLGTVQSNISMQISKLEHELGAGLCKRTHSGVVPTPAGEHLYRLARDIIAEVEFISRYIRSSLDEDPVRIALAAPVAPRGSLLAGALQTVAYALGKRHPHVKLRLIDFLGGPVSTNDEVGAVAEARDSRDMFDPLEVRDDWGLISRRGESALTAGKLAVTDLERFAGQLRFVMPKFPPSIAALGGDFAKSAGISVASEDIAIDQLETLFSNPATAVIMPLSCIPGFAFQQRFQLSYVGSQTGGMVWRIKRVGNADRLLIGAITELFSDELRAALDWARTRSHTAPERLTRPGRRTGPANGDGDDPLSLRELRTFDIAYDRGNISRAAADLGVSQPALSNTLKKLERAIGHALFVRTAHGVAPTKRAIALRRLCEPVLSDLAEARLQIREIGLRELPPIRFGVLPVLDDESLLAQTVSGTISDWMQLSNGCNLRLTEGFNESLRRWTVQALLDFAVVDTEARQSGLIVTPLARDSMVVITNPRLGVLPPGPVKAADIRHLRLILPSVRHGLRGLIDRAFNEAGLSLVPLFEVDSMAMTLNLVDSDDWATILPISAIHKRAKANKIQVNNIIEPEINRCLSLIRRAGSTPSENVNRFLELLMKRVNEANVSMRGLI
ncbi:LysR family transcriptional regulator [Bradyrhizobium prioriisuperbiae]|uniref:LysR family transcriptional regulator n=1 Tax=Bradyrhizobium prioriisuperbiae TaxID=2854389 RepID=UPI0028EFBD12|nr:LysR family transcriptional regulator [Bradyrhizobium prioritasuperba]